MHTNEKGELVLRTQLQVDVPPNLKRAIKELAARKDQSVKRVVLEALEASYPELKPYVKSALTES